MRQSCRSLTTAPMGRRGSNRGSTFRPSGSCRTSTFFPSRSRPKRRDHGLRRAKTAPCGLVPPVRGCGNVCRGRRFCCLCPRCRSATTGEGLDRTRVRVTDGRGTTRRNGGTDSSVAIRSTWRSGSHTARIVVAVIILVVLVAVVVDNKDDTRIGYVFGDVEAPLFVVLIARPRSALCSDGSFHTGPVIIETPSRRNLSGSAHSDARQGIADATAARGRHSSATARRGSAA